jgi:hypothetical protein
LIIRLKKYAAYKFALLWGSGVLLFLLPLKLTEPRQAICLVPALTILSMQVIWFFKKKFATLLEQRSIYVILLVVLIFLHFSPRKLWGGPDVQGFDQAADFIVRDRDCVSVLYDGYFNGNFIFHMRERDEGMRVFVFRASKVLFSTKWLVSEGYWELTQEVAEFIEILDRYSIKYIVQEERDLVNTLTNKRLRGWIQGPEFRLARKYPISFCGLSGFGSLLVYEYLDYEAKPLKQIDLDMPTLGRRISVRLQ